MHLRWSSKDDTGSITVVATYFPTTVTAAERDVNYMCIEDLIGFATSRWTKHWLAVGDWNMHIGIDKTPDFKQRGPYGLAVPTTVAGKAWIKFMETHDDWNLVRHLQTNDTERNVEASMWQVVRAGSVLGTKGTTETSTQHCHGGFRAERPHGKGDDDDVAHG